MATKLQPEFEGLGELELLQLMAAGDSLAVDAWEEFHTRHRGYLYAVCTKVFTGRVGEQRIEDIVQDALVRAFHKAGTLGNEAGLDGVSQRRLVRAWLGKICEHIVSDYFRRQPDVDFVDKEVLEAHEAAETHEDPADEVDPVYAARLRIIEEALDTLTDREREVIRTTMIWSKLGQKKGHMPRKVMTDLTTSLKISSDYVRKIRERAMTKVKAYVDSHAQNIKE